MFSSSEKLKSEHFSSILFSGVIWQKVMRCQKVVMRNAQKKKENLGEREPLVFFISLVSRTVTKVVVLFVRNLHLNIRYKHTNYVCKTYGRDSRSQEIGTSRESRDRCHLLRARIRHADVDQFVYQRQRLIFKGIKIFLLVLLLGAFLSLFSSSFILLRLQIERNGFDHLDAASTCVYASCLLLR